jgi:hypothetical protein
MVVENIVDRELDLGTPEQRCILDRVVHIHVRKIERIDGDGLIDRIRFLDSADYVDELAVIVVILAHAFIRDADVPAPVLPQQADRLDIAGRICHPLTAVGEVRAGLIFRGAQ